VSNFKLKISEYIDNSISILELLKKDNDMIEIIFNLIKNAQINKKRIYLLGNGGSSSTASHFVCDLNKTAKINGQNRIHSFALNDNIPHIFAISNDIGFDAVFEEQLKNFLDKGDIVIAISGSGNSKNILNAVKFANDSGAKTIGLTGFDGGKLKEICHHCLVVPSDKMYHIEDIHLVINHIITFLFVGYSYKK
jgi:D-sedoheptulose 7-phosphate isomerase